MVDVDHSVVCCSCRRYVLLTVCDVDVGNWNMMPCYGALCLWTADGVRFYGEPSPLAYNHHDSCCSVPQHIAACDRVTCVCICGYIYCSGSA